MNGKLLNLLTNFTQKKTNETHQFSLFGKRYEKNETTCANKHPWFQQNNGHRFYFMPLKSNIIFAITGCYKSPKTLTKRRKNTRTTEKSKNPKNGHKRLQTGIKRYVKPKRNFFE